MLKIEFFLIAINLVKKIKIQILPAFPEDPLAPLGWAGVVDGAVAPVAETGVFAPPGLKPPVVKVVVLPSLLAEKD